MSESNDEVPAYRLYLQDLLDRIPDLRELLRRRDLREREALDLRDRLELLELLDRRDLRKLREIQKHD